MELLPGREGEDARPRSKQMKLEGPRAPCYRCRSVVTFSVDLYASHLTSPPRDEGGPAESDAKCPWEDETLQGGSARWPG